MEQAVISIKHAIIKHAQTIGMIQRTHQKMKTILMGIISADQSQYEKFVQIAEMSHYTTYHAWLKCASKKFLHGRTPQTALDLKFANPIRVTKQPTDILKMLDQVSKKTSTRCTTSSQHTINTRQTMAGKPVLGHSKSTKVCSTWTHSMTTRARNILNGSTSKGPTNWGKYYPIVTTSMDR